MGDISNGVANTLYSPLKKNTKKFFQYFGLWFKFSGKSTYSLAYIWLKRIQYAAGKIMPIRPDPQHWFLVPEKKNPKSVPPVSLPWAGLRCHQASYRNREGYLGIQTGTLDSRRIPYPWLHVGCLYGIDTFCVWPQKTTNKSSCIWKK